MGGSDEVDANLKPVKEVSTYLFSTVPNDSYRFWAVLPLEGYVLTVSNIHK